MEPLAQFKAEHGGMTVAQFAASQQNQGAAATPAATPAAAPATSESTTTSSGQVEPLAMFKQEHNGMNVAQWANYEAAQQ